MTDQLIRATAADNGIRVIGVTSTDLIKEAQVRHRLSYVATAALGRAMTAGLLLASNMKQPQSRVNLRIRGTGPLRGLMVDAGLNGTVRGYVDNPSVELLPNAAGKLDVAGAIGAGYLFVMRDIGYGEPSTSTVELVSGEIGDDVTYYLARSEQTPSALVLGELTGIHGIQVAGGLLIQILPKAAEDQALVELLESRCNALSHFTPMLHEGKTLIEIMTDLLGDIDLKILPEFTDLQFYCPCSLQRVLGALKMLGQTELKDMIEKDDGAEVTCDFCGEVYHVDANQLYQLIAELNAQRSQVCN